MNQHFYIYDFEDSQQRYAYSSVAHDAIYAGITYNALSSIRHSEPTFSSDPSKARITVSLRDDLSVALNYISHPPPFKTSLTIWEVLEVTVSGNQLLVTQVEPHWSGRIVRVSWRDNFRSAEITCRTQQDIHFSRESNTQGLDPLCRFHLGDGRCPVNIENFKETATVTDIDFTTSEPTIEVSGLVQTNDYYVPGMIRLGDGDMRQVEACETSGGDKLLTLSRAFPSTSVQIGDSVEVFAGDDLTQETCTVIFGTETDDGAAWGGWKLTPNRDYQRNGIR